MCNGLPLINVTDKLHERPVIEYNLVNLISIKIAGVMKGVLFVFFIACFNYWGSGWIRDEYSIYNFCVLCLHFLMNMLGMY